MDMFLKQDELAVEQYASRKAMGEAAAKEVAAKIAGLQREKESVNIIFAAAPSQNEFLEALIAAPGIDWRRVNGFHMDEYIGLAADAPQGFGNFLRGRLFGRLPFGQVFYLDGQAADPQAECARYSALLAEYPADIVCLGIGENGHIAFNDPHVARFDDPVRVKVVDLDDKCRRQQVHDGCFQSLDEVPTQAFTLTIPILMSAAYTFCIVPASTKAEAVYNTLYAPLCEEYPSTILREKENARLYLDMESGSLLPVEILTNP